MLFFKLIDKTTGEEAKINTTVDEQICKLLDRPVDNHHYCSILKDAEVSWYDTIGLALATGKTYDDCRKLWPNDNGMQDDINKVIDFLEVHYTVDCGYKVY